MKKQTTFLLFIVTIFLPISISFGYQTTQCNNFKEQELSKIQKVQYFLKHNTTKLNDAFPKTDNITTNFINKLSYTVSCQKEGYSNYNEFINGFKTFVYNLLASKSANTYEDTEAQNAILILQEHINSIFSSFSNLYTTSSIINTNNQNNIQINLNIPPSLIDTDYINESVKPFIANIEINNTNNGTINLDTKEAKSNNILDISTKINGYLMNLENDPETNLLTNSIEPANLDSLLKLDIDLIIKNNIYFKIKDFIFSAESDNQEVNNDIEFAQSLIYNTYEQIKDKYIKIDMNKDLLNTILPQISQTSNKTNNKKLDPIVSFSQKENNIRYGYIDNSICEIISKDKEIVKYIGLESDYDCNNKINELNKNYQQKGYLLMKKLGSTYTLSLSPQASNLLGKQIKITWDKEQIQEININLNNEGNVIYKDHTIQADYNNNSIKFTVNGTIDTNKIHLNTQGTIILPMTIQQAITFDSTLSITKDSNTNSNTIFNLNTYFQQDKIFELTFDQKSTSSPAQNLNIQEPKDYINIDEIDSIF